MVVRSTKRFHPFQSYVFASYLTIMYGQPTWKLVSFRARASLSLSVEVKTFLIVGRYSVILQEAIKLGTL